MQQEHRGTLDGTYVPEPRTTAHDDDVAVGTAPAADHDATDHDPDERADEYPDESYPAGTYASGSAAADADRDLDGRDGVEVVDHDAALAEETDQRDVFAPPTDEDVREEDVRAEDASSSAEEASAASVDEAEHDDDDRFDETVDGPSDGTGVVAEDERDEVETAHAEVAEDEHWEAAHDVDAADREWAAAHATQLRAGSVDTADSADSADSATLPETSDDKTDDETLAVSETVDDTDHRAEPAFEPVPAAIDDRTDADGDGDGDGDTDADDAAVAGAESSQGDLLPGAVEAAPMGAVWAEGAADGLRDRWRELQLRFIDDPRSVAGEADELVGEAVASVTAALEAQRRQLNSWQSEGGEDTERLRAAVRQYRDFFDRLLGL